MSFVVHPSNVEIRKNISNEVKEHKVNNKGKTTVENNTRNPFVKEEKNEKEDKNNKRWIIIDGVKTSEIEIEAEIHEEALKDNSKGLFLDKLK